MLPRVSRVRSIPALSFVAATAVLLFAVLLFPPAAGATGDPVIAAAGDIACDPASRNFNGGDGTATACHEKETGDQLLAGVTNGVFDAVLALGDTQYECGGYQAYQQSYDPTWGQVGSVTYPVIGNHEYNTRGGMDCGTKGSGYFQYFYPSRPPPTGGYYSFDVGSWHLVALNANCSFVECKVGSPQEQWLANDLATHPNTCTLAFWHQPRFSVGPTTLANVLPFWKDLYAAHADLVINGHKHNYERLTKVDPNGSPDPSGIREIIAGTGGVNRSIGSKLYPGTEASDGKHFGILELTLHPTSYDWKFVADDGTMLDFGSDDCVT